MAKTYSDLLQDVKGQIKQVSLDEMKRRLEAKEAYVFVDVREKDETEPASSPAPCCCRAASSRCRPSRSCPTRTPKIVVYCAGGTRSAFAAKTLQELGYTQRRVRQPRLRALEGPGLPGRDARRSSPPAQLDRYSRHLLLPEVGEKGQEKLLKARVLLLGAGGLGSPAALYLAAAGVGTLGLVDADTVDASNLQRQILHGTDRVGMPKVESAEKTHQRPEPRREGREVPGAPDQRERRSHLRSGLGRDRRRLRQLPDALPRQRRVGLAQDPRRARLDLPLRRTGHDVHGRARGPATAASTRSRRRRTSRPRARRPACSASCPASSASIQATEAIKLILGQGEPLIGRLLTYDSLKMTFRTLKLRRDKNCPVCGENPTIKEYIDYEGFCSR